MDLTIEEAIKHAMLTINAIYLALKEEDEYLALALIQKLVEDSCVDDLAAHLEEVTGRKRFIRVYDGVH